VDRAEVFGQNVRGRLATLAGLEQHGCSALAIRRDRGLEISGFGDGGPYCRRPAYDLIVQAERDRIGDTGDPGKHWQRPGCRERRYTARAWYAVNSVLAALYEREERRGRPRILG